MNAHPAVLFALATGAVMAGSFMGIAASPVVAVPQGLSISITDDEDEVAPNSDTTYTAILVNGGAKSVSAIVTVTVPDYAQLSNAVDGDVNGTTATWTIKVKPGEEKDFTAEVHVGDIPETEYRVTTIASVYLDSVEDAPLIRSADANTIPGVTDPVVVVPGAEPQEASNGWLTLGIVVLVALVVVVILLIAVFVRTRGRRGAAGRGAGVAAKGEESL